MKEKVLIDTQDDDLVPLYATELSSGADVKADIKENIILKPSESILVPTGIRLQIPPGFEVQVRPRSGLALKNQITVLNSPGTIDSDFRGEIGVILINHGKEPFIILPKMRIGQLVLTKVYQAEFVKGELSSTIRERGGFGHSGKF
ncbi:MAG: dUTP diphosphatase [Chlamydiae bacterium]|nr:dUTP diphosphatase [Chlamydiota bacterium]